MRVYKIQTNTQRVFVPLRKDARQDNLVRAEAASRFTSESMAQCQGHDIGVALGTSFV